MTDQITVNVEDLRRALRGLRGTGYEHDSWAHGLEDQLAQHDKAEQERNDKLVFVAKDDDEQFEYEDLRWQPGPSSAGFWHVCERAVEALGDFYPHQTDHTYERITYKGAQLCAHCDSPEWAHTTPEPKVPDWLTDPNVLVVDALTSTGETEQRFFRLGDEAWLGADGKVQPWHSLPDFGPIVPVGWRRDPDSITIPKSALERTDSSDWRDQAINLDLAGFLRASRLANVIADALEADQ